MSTGIGRLCLPVVALLLVATTLAGCGSSRSASSQSPVHKLSASSTTTSAAGHGTPANLAPQRSLALGVGGCPAAWAAEPLLPCKNIPSVFSPDPSSGTSSGMSASVRAQRFAQPTGCTHAVLETLIVGDSTTKADSQGAILASAAVTCPSAVDALRGFEKLTASTKKEISNTVPDPHVATVGQSSIVFFSATSHHDTGVGVAVANSTILFVEVSASTTLPVSADHELTLPNAVVSFLQDQYRKLLQVGTVRLPLPSPNLAASEALSPGVGGCPQAWLSAPLLPCKDIPRVFSPDPSAGDTGNGSRNTQALSSGNKYGCTGAASEIFVTGTSAKQAALQGAILVSEDFSCPSAANADSAMRGTFASLGVTADPSAPHLGDLSEVGTSTTSGQDKAGVTVVSGTSVASIAVLAAPSLPSKVLRSLVSPNAIASFARDQLAQLHRAGGVAP